MLTKSFVVHWTKIMFAFVFTPYFGSLFLSSLFTYNYIRFLFIYELFLYTYFLFLPFTPFDNTGVCCTAGTQIAQPCLNFQNSERIKREKKEFYRIFFFFDINVRIFVGTDVSVHDVTDSRIIIPIFLC